MHSFNWEYILNVFFKSQPRLCMYISRLICQSVLLDAQGKFADGEGSWEFEGNTYEGQFKEGYFNGQASFTWSTGERFIGEFDTDCPVSGMLKQGQNILPVAYDGVAPLFSCNKPHALLTFEALKVASGDYLYSQRFPGTCT